MNTQKVFFKFKKAINTCVVKSQSLQPHRDLPRFLPFLPFCFFINNIFCTKWIKMSTNLITICGILFAPFCRKMLFSLCFLHKIYCKVGQTVIKLCTPIFIHFLRNIKKNVKMVKMERFLVSMFLQWKSFLLFFGTFWKQQNIIITLNHQKVACEPFHCVHSFFF